ncbi:FixH family protein [Tistrella mobilis]|uniref:FixH family protein n=1 Tax=Tistrella mobilis TaxID=171437 RepID=UPI003556F3DF
MARSLPMQPRTAASGRRSAWIPWVFVGGFLVVVAVNATLIVKALDGFTGVVVEKPFERGLDYDRLIAAADAQARLGWTITTAVEPGAPAGESDFALTLAGPDGPLADATVDARLQRPLDGERVTLMAMPRPGGPAGAWRLVGPGVRPGQWDLHVIVTRGKDRHISTHRLWIAPATGEAGAKAGETE